MKSGDCSDKAPEGAALALVDPAWMADRGSIIVVLNRDADGSLFDRLDAVACFEMDGEIRIVTDSLHDGETVHLESVDQVVPPVS